jgi:UDP-glucose 4-epimerase
MKILVTGSAGHLGEAIMRTLEASRHEGVGIDLLPSSFTHRTGSIVDRQFVRDCMSGIDAVIHTATLHKPHVATHSRQSFVDTNISGTLNLLEEAADQGVGRFAFTSTTSVFGKALVPAEGEPAAWITEDVTPVPKNIYGVTKAAAEDLCHLQWQISKLPCLVLRTSRFFPEEDDSKLARSIYSDANLKMNEFLHRRVDIEDVVNAHLLAIEHAPKIGFGRYIVSATTPFGMTDLGLLRSDAQNVVANIIPDYVVEFQKRGWCMFPKLDRVYVNDKARTALGWRPKYDFARLLGQLRSGQTLGSELAQAVGQKGYHSQTFKDGPYPIEHTPD